MDLGGQGGPVTLQVYILLKPYRLVKFSIKINKKPHKCM